MNIRRCCCVYGSCGAAAECRALCSWRRRAYRIGNQLDVRGCRAAATTNKLGARLNKPFGKFRHVLRRAHIKLSSLHVTRQSCVRLCRKLLLRDLAHLLERAENDRWSNSAVQSNNIRAPLVEPLSKQLRRRTKHRVAVSHDRHLRDDRQIAELTHGGDRLANL